MLPGISSLQRSSSAMTVNLQVCHSVQLEAGWTAMHQALLYWLLLHQAPVMWQDLTLREIQRHLQSHQDGELKGYQLFPADSESLLQLLHRHRSE